MLNLFFNMSTQGQANNLLQFDSCYNMVNKNLKRVDEAMDGFTYVVTFDLDLV